MTHRTTKIDGTVFNVFDSQAGADRFIKANPDGEISVVLRRKWLLMRRNGVDMKIDPAGTVSSSAQATVQSAGQAVLDEVEAMIKLEMA